MPPTAPRLLIVPGLRDSGPGHWQTWLQGLCEGSVRVVQRNWAQPDLERWSARIANTLERAGPGPWIIAAHSFGSLATAHYLARLPSDHAIVAALLVAPAEPDKFGLAEALPHQALPVPTTVVSSLTDPWMSATSAQRWAARWGSTCINAGNAGHINVESGHGPWPFARRWVMSTEQRLSRHLPPVQPSMVPWQSAV